MLVSRFRVEFTTAPHESALLRARAVGEEQASRIGHQTGGWVFLYLHTDDFWRDFRAYQAKDIGSEIFLGILQESFATCRGWAMRT